MNILTFDIEEWYHILDNDSTIGEKQWNNYESRIHSNMDKIFSFLNENNLKATFFIVGWIANKHPEIVKEIDNLGFEIGSHTHMHQLMYNQSKKEVSEDLKKSISIIQELTGKKVKYFRAPGFSITVKNKWAFEVLYNNGITHDCSVFPAGRAHGGMPAFSESVPSYVKYNGVKIKEFPINTLSFLNKKIIYSGGGYFRLMPYKFIKYYSSKSKYIMTYFHPRDFDEHQPVIKDLNLLRKFKSYVGLRGAMKKLNKWANDVCFVDLGTADKIINWEVVPIVNL